MQIRIRTDSTSELFLYRLHDFYLPNRVLLVDDGRKLVQTLSMDIDALRRMLKQAHKKI